MDLNVDFQYEQESHCYEGGGRKLLAWKPFRHLGYIERVDRVARSQYLRFLGFRGAIVFRPIAPSAEVLRRWTKTLSFASIFSYDRAEEDEVGLPLKRVIICQQSDLPKMP